jgi:hypothetical protein
MFWSSRWWQVCFGCCVVENEMNGCESTVCGQTFDMLTCAGKSYCLYFGEWIGFIHSIKDRGVLDVGATTDGTKRWHLLPLLHLLPTKRCGSMPTSQDWYGVVSSWNMRSFSVLLCHFLSRLTSNNMIARSGLR